MMDQGVKATEDSSDVVVRELSKARMQLIYTYPLLGEFALSLDLIVLDRSNWCHTAATDTFAIYFNRQYVISLYHDAGNVVTRHNGRERLKALIAHEIWHVILNHLMRRGNRDKDYWWMAIDYAANALLVEEKIGILPDGGLVDKRFHSDMTAEEIYVYLRRNKAPVKPALDLHIEPTSDGDSKSVEIDGSPDDSADGSPDEDSPGDQQLDGEGAGSDDGASPDDFGAGDGEIRVESGDDMDGPPSRSIEQFEKRADAIRDAVIRAYHDDPGSFPAGVARTVEKLVKPIMDWRRLISATLRSQRPDEFSYDVLSDSTWASWFHNRRHWKPGSKFSKHFCAIIPSQVEAQKIKVLLAYDMSQSVTARMVQESLSEIKGVATSFPDYEIHVVSFDVEVHNHEVFTPDNISDLTSFHSKRIKGGGGTNPTCVVDFARKNRISVEKLIMFTDGEIAAGQWGDPNFAETIFVINNKRQRNIRAPYGRTVYYE